MSHPVAREPVRRTATALMYHALANGLHPAGQDPHYTIDASTFGDQIDLLVLGRRSVGSARDWLGSDGDVNNDETGLRPVVLTFDDGHESNHEIAFPVLLERGATADFFVNPANVGRDGYASWQSLREMADSGMSIQSHGYDHVYLTDLAGNLRSSLIAARNAIEDKIGKPATLLAPPGGRVTSDLLQVARECGYSHVLGSRPGRMTSTNTGILPRMSVTAATTTPTLQRWVSAGPMSLIREHMRYSVLSSAKQLLGDHRYERMRASALPGGRN